MTHQARGLPLFAQLGWFGARVKRQVWKEGLVDLQAGCEILSALSDLHSPISRMLSRVADAVGEFIILLLYLCEGQHFWSDKGEGGDGAPRSRASLPPRRVWKGPWKADYSHFISCLTSLSLTCSACHWFCLRALLNCTRTPGFSPWAGHKCSLEFHGRIFGMCFWKAGHAKSLAVYKDSLHTIWHIQPRVLFLGFEI
jgi:hypothetical protein